jgi:hypothetical protein
MSRSYGLNLDKERAEQSPEDWQFGALSQPGLANIPLSLRTKFLPLGELQRGLEDFSDCVTRGYHNILESQFTWLYQNGMSEENRKWLLAKGFVTPQGRIEFSDRFTAILSGTTPQGNSMKAPAESIRKNGLIPKSMLPKQEGMTFAQYHDRAKITEEMLDIGRQFSHRFTINYEQVNRSHIKEANKDDLLAVALHAWSFPENGIYPRTDNTLNHCVMLIQPEYEAFDNYTEAVNDYTKTLAPDYIFYEYAYRIFISAEKSYTEQVSLWTRLVAALASIVAILSKPEPKPVPPANNLLNVFCKEIERHEGFFPPSPKHPNGSRSWRNKNPGNLVFVGQPGATKEKDGRFAVFPTYEAGFEALKNMIRNAATGKSKIYKPSMNLYQFFAIYAPSFENDDRHYAETVAKALNVSPESFKISQLI